MDSNGNQELLAEVAAEGLAAVIQQPSTRRWTPTTRLQLSRKKTLLQLLRSAVWILLKSSEKGLRSDLKKSKTVNNTILSTIESLKSGRVNRRSGCRMISGSQCYIRTKPKSSDGLLLLETRSADVVYCWRESTPTSPL